MSSDDILLPQDDPPVVDAEVVRPQPPAASTSPLRFGLKAMFVFVAICSVQFALMSSLGAMRGLLIGTAVCVVLLIGLIFAGILFAGSHGSTAMDRVDQLAIRLTLALVMLVVGTILAGGGMIVYEQTGKFYLAAKMQRDLGFTFHCEDAWTNNGFASSIRVIVVDSVTPGGAFEKAGFRKQDVIVSQTPPYELLEQYDENRGQTVDVSVASGGVTSAPLEKRTTRNLSLNIPSQ